MEDLRTYDTSALIDMLSKYTMDYTKMLSEGTTEEEYSKIDLTIRAL